MHYSFDVRLHVLFLKLPCINILNSSSFADSNDHDPVYKWIVPLDLLYSYNHQILVRESVD